MYCESFALVLRFRDVLAVSTLMRLSANPWFVPQAPHPYFKWMVIASAHIFVLWGLLNQQPPRARERWLPLMVALISPALPEPLKPSEPTPAARLQPVPPAQVAKPVGPLAPAPTPAAQVALPPLPLHQATTALATEATNAANSPDAPAAPVPSTAAEPTRPAISPSAPPAPRRQLAASAVQYRVLPPVEVPRASRRAGEAGTVWLRVVVGTAGEPVQVSVHRSSGFARLDEQALWAMRQARFLPHTENGRALEVEVIAPIEYPAE
jgi:periplasmic protein TonB